MPKNQPTWRPRVPTDVASADTTKIKRGPWGEAECLFRRDRVSGGIYAFWPNVRTPARTPDHWRSGWYAAKQDAERSGRRTGRTTGIGRSPQCGSPMEFVLIAVLATIAVLHLVLTFPMAAHQLPVRAYLFPASRNPMTSPALGEKGSRDPGIPMTVPIPIAWSPNVAVVRRWRSLGTFRRGRHIDSNVGSSESHRRRN